MTILELLTRDTELRAIGMNHKRHSVEYAGPCPFCGGTDRFRVWPEAEHPHYWCRQCKANGDAIQYLRTHDKMSFYQACRLLGITPGVLLASVQTTFSTSLDLTHPNEAWQQQAKVFCRTATETLWSAQGTGMLAYLHSRGFQDESILKAGLGYHPVDKKEPASTWGLEADKPIWIPSGLVIPSVISDAYWRINIRTGQAPRPYMVVAGSLSSLYQADLLSKEKPAMLLESELDALLVYQSAGDLIIPVATEGTSGARHLYWISHLAAPSSILISYDADDAGDHAAKWWQAHLPHARRWRPLVKDPGEMHRMGISIRDWVEDAIPTRVVSSARPAFTMSTSHKDSQSGFQMHAGNSPAPRLYSDPSSPSWSDSEKKLPWRILLNCLPQHWQDEEIAIEAAKAYFKAGEPPISVLLWHGCTIPDQLRGLNLWSILGEALTSDEGTKRRAVQVLEYLAINGGGAPSRNRS